MVTILGLMTILEIHKNKFTYSILVTKTLLLAYTTWKKVGPPFATLNKKRTFMLNGT